jgi:hypothetical protein
VNRASGEVPARSSGASVNRAGSDPAVRYAHKVLAEMDKLSIRTHRESAGKAPDADTVRLMHERNWGDIGSHEAKVRKAFASRKPAKKIAARIYEGKL